MIYPLFYVTPLGGRVEVEVRKVVIDLSALSGNELERLSAMCREELERREQEVQD